MSIDDESKNTKRRTLEEMEAIARAAGVLDETDDEEEEEVLMILGIHNPTRIFRDDLRRMQKEEKEAKARIESVKPSEESCCED